MPDRLARLLIALVSGFALGAAPDRDAFLSRNGEGQESALIHDYANVWAEYVDGVDRYRFVETSRSADTVELLDPGRDIGLRVHDDSAEIRMRGSKAWRAWARGRWIEKAALPASIRFMPTDWKVRLAYFVPTDREPIEGYERRIRVVMEFVNDAYRADLAAKGHPTAGLPFEADAQGRPIVRLIRGKMPASHYNKAPNFNTTFEHFDRIAEEVPAALASPGRHLIVLFPETYDPGPAPIEWNGSVGVGSNASTDGGLAIMSAWMLRDEFCARTFEDEKKYLRDSTPIRGRAALGTRRMNSPRSEFIEDGWGATVHEIGHALGLPHDNRGPNDLMGQGFRRLKLNYPSTPPRTRPVAFSPENARLLFASRHLFPDVDRTDNFPPTAEARLQAASSPSASAVVHLKAADDRALRAVVFLDQVRDTVLGGAELKGRSQTLDVKLPLRPAGARPRLLAIVADGGGNLTRVEAATSPR
ncbi:Putative peptidase family protein [Aquisphaera giovannonii]|uniref:Peptidase family protein n=1 Tax=Aquisphaera giovannonii TaxID=406548 RepID=A0A5B9W6P2_9BACT|nr:hypothetical protein [Aquisphaera giovannonii]QEH35997.1 Putative peptidase family protein [Aquisphaera giovannonii]